MAFPALTFRRVFLLLLAALSVSSLLKSKYCVYGPPLRNAVHTVLMPMARPLNDVTAAVRSERDRPVLGDLEQLSDELRYKDALILSLQKRVRELEATSAELQGLSQRLGQDYVFREARVIGRAADPSAGTLTIDKGASVGLSPGLAIVKGADLVGRLIEVGPTTSIIRLITTPDELIEVALTPPRLPTDQPTDFRQRVAQLRVVGPAELIAEDVDREVPVQAGDYARLMDDRGPESWPDAVQGMIVGRVVKVEPNPDQKLLKTVTVMPMRSLRRLDTVTVVVPRYESKGGG
jgi:rod shape-determining protein MreC